LKTNFFFLHCLSYDRSTSSSKANSPHSASSFNLQFSLFSLRSSSICLCRLHRLPVPSIFPSKTCFRRQFLRKTWPIQLAFLHCNACRM